MYAKRITVSMKFLKGDFSYCKNTFQKIIQQTSKTLVGMISIKHPAHKN